MDSAEARRAVIVECGQALGFEELKEKQIEAIDSLVLIPSSHSLLDTESQ